MASLISPTGNAALMQMQMASSDRAPSAVPGANGKVDMASIKKAATDFEATFATEMMSHMFEGVGQNSAFGGGHGEEVFRSLLVEQYGKAIAGSGQLGIANKVAAEMIKMQEAAR